MCNTAYVVFYTVLWITYVSVSPRWDKRWKLACAILTFFMDTARTKSLRRMKVGANIKTGLRNGG